MNSIKTKSYQNVFAFDRRNESCFYSIYIDDKQSIEICENKIVNYVKAWKHTELNIKGKMPLASLEGMDSDDTIVLVDGDRVYDLVSEGKISIVLDDMYYVVKLDMLIMSCLLMKMNLTHGFVCRRCLCYGCAHSQHKKSKILFDALYRTIDEVTGGL